MDNLPSFSHFTIYKSAHPKIKPNLLPCAQNQKAKPFLDLRKLSQAAHWRPPLVGMAPQVFLAGAISLKSPSVLTRGGGALRYSDFCRECLCQCFCVNICRKQECVSYANPSKTENMAKREKVDVCVCVCVRDCPEGGDGGGVAWQLHDKDGESRATTAKVRSWQLRGTGKEAQRTKENKPSL